MTGGKQSGVAIVTGAAGGMGAPSVRMLAAQGYSIILCDLNGDALEALAAPLRAAGQSMEILTGSVADADFPDRLATQIGDREVGAVIHTAGISPTRGDAELIYSVNYDATERLLGVVQPRMAAGACAVLIASSSAYFMTDPQYDEALKSLAPGDSATALVARWNNPGLAYAVSKRGVIRLVVREAPAFGKRKARLVSISPGLIDTAMGRDEAKDSPQMEMMLNKTPLERYGEGEEIASVAVFLCSPGASFVSGCDILVDGGVVGAVLA